VPKYTLTYHRNSGSARGPRQLPSHEHLDEVGEIVGGEEGDPGHVGVTDEAQRHRTDSGGEQANGLRRVVVHARVELAEAPW
jgi:hypothetical protein